MQPLDDRDLEQVTGGKMPRGATEATLSAWADLAKTLGRNGNKIGGAADSIGGLAEDIRKRLGPS